MWKKEALWVSLELTLFARTLQLFTRFLKVSYHLSKYDVQGLQKVQTTTPNAKTRREYDNKVRPMAISTSNSKGKSLAACAPWTWQKHVGSPWVFNQSLRREVSKHPCKSWVVHSWLRKAALSFGNSAADWGVGSISFPVRARCARTRFRTASFLTLPVEVVGKGSLLTITSLGSLYLHFPIIPITLDFNLQL